MKIWRLGLMSYDTALKIQLALARKHLDAAIKGQDTNFDTLLLVEHKPVFTVDNKVFKSLQTEALVMWIVKGPQDRDTKLANGIRDDTSTKEISRLKSLGAEFKKTNRGGLITFHGPGQLVAYPVINLKHFKTSVKWYVQSLEETVINVCDELGIKGNRSKYTGVWVNDNKIAAIGIHASRYVTTHGISLNCDNDLSWFDNIDPCGIDDKGVTSLTKESGIVCTVEKTIPIFVKCFSKVFDCETEEIDTKMQEEILNSIYNNMLVQDVAAQKIM